MVLVNISLKNIHIILYFINYTKIRFLQKKKKQSKHNINMDKIWNKILLFILEYIKNKH